MTISSGTAPAGGDRRDAIFDTSDLTEGIDRRAGEASVLILAMMVVKVGLQFGGLAVIARLVSPAEQGIVAMAMPVVMVSMMLSNFGLSQALVQHREMTHGLATALFWLNAAFGLTATALVAALGWPAAQFYGEPRVAGVFAALSLTVALSAVAGQYIAILRRRMRIAAAELTNLAGIAAGVAAGVAAAVAGWSYWALVVQQLVAPVLMLALLLAITRWLPSRPWTHPVAPAYRALRFGGALAGANLCRTVADQLPIIVAGRLFGDAPAGVYYRAHTVADMPRSRIVRPLSGAFVPALSRLQSDPAAFRALFTRAVNRALLLLLPVTVLLIAAPDLIVALLLGPDWGAAVPLLAVLGLRSAVIGPERGLHWCCIAMGATLPLLLLGAFNLVLVAVAIAIGAAFGLTGLAVAYALTQIGVALPVLVWIALRHTPVRGATLRRACLGDLAFAAAAAGAVLALRAALPAWPVLGELVAVGLALAALMAAKILATPAQRADLVKILARAAGWVTPRRPAS